MKVKCTEINCTLSNDLNIYFEDEKGKHYYWWTKSNKAFEEIYVGDKYEITSCEMTDGFDLDGIFHRVIKNVRFKEL